MPKQLMASDRGVEGDKVILRGNAACTPTESSVQKPTKIYTELAASFYIIQSEILASLGKKLTVSSPEGTRRIVIVIASRGLAAAFLTQIMAVKCKILSIWLHVTNVKPSYF